MDSIDQREAREERVIGYKVGSPIAISGRVSPSLPPFGGPVWDSTLLRCQNPPTLSLQVICQPRLEPELVFGMAATPPPDASLEALFGCVDWLAPGFEIVQSHCPGWKTNAADMVADGAVHARLVLGPARPVRALGYRSRARCAACRGSDEVDLRPVAQGRGRRL